MALCSSQYVLSSQENFGANKDLIFVKLTDSAYRAIEELLKAQNKLGSQSPTIKFLGNEGQLSFPSQNGYTSFNFSMSSTSDMEGPGGSFECVQQSGPPRGPLEMLGALPHKIRIHANDDVYEATRVRMNAAEEIHKNKCTREIKPNQNDIGKKIKVKQLPGRTVPPPRPQPSLRDSLSKPTHQLNLSSSKPSLVHSSNGLSNGLGSNHVSSSSRPSKPSNDLTRRPLKERLIHLLAMRPFKKPELYDRVNKDGSTKDRSCINVILKQISTMRDNTYHLNRHMWNDVNDEWPFYTDQERQMMKRRKPQNLTPPGSSDGGSSGSGHSPTSTHPGSPPPTLPSAKRPGYYDGVDGFPTKKPRISHYVKPMEPYRPPDNPQRKPVTDSRDASNMNPRSRELPTIMVNGCSGPINNGHNIGSNYGMNNEKQRNYSDEEIEPANRKRSCDSHNSLSYGMNRGKTLNGNSGNTNTNSNCASPKLSSIDHLDSSPIQRKTIDSLPFDKQNNQLTNNVNVVNNQQMANGKSKLSTAAAEDSERENARWNKVRKKVNSRKILPLQDKGTLAQKTFPITQVTSTTLNGHLTRVSPESPDSQADIRNGQSENCAPPVDSLATVRSDFPEYLTEYTTIKDSEQRRRYKADFNADYAEYRDLHAVVEQVSKRFAQLEERLKQEENRSRESQEYKDIKKQIVKEYQQNKLDGSQQEAKRRFQYLHDKLSHIKRLVLEYDQNATSDHQHKQLRKSASERAY